MKEFDSIKQAVLDEVGDLARQMRVDVEALKGQYAAVLDEFQPQIDEQIAAWATGSPWAEAQVEALLGQMKARFAGMTLDAIRRTRMRILLVLRVALRVLFGLLASAAA